MAGLGSKRPGWEKKGPESISCFKGGPSDASEQTGIMYHGARQGAALHMQTEREREEERKREREKDGVRASQIYFSKLETTGSMRSEDFQDIPQLNIVNITQRGKRMLFSFMAESSQMFSSFHGTCC